LGSEAEERTTACILPARSGRPRCNSSRVCARLARAEQPRGGSLTRRARRDLLAKGRALGSPSPATAARRRSAWTRIRTWTPTNASLEKQVD